MVLTAAAVVVVVFYGVRVQRAARVSRSLTSHWSNPWAAMPSPNAFGYFTAAAKELRHQKQIDEAVYPPELRNTSSEHVYTLAEKEALVRANRQVLAKLRHAFTYRFCFPLRYGIEAMCPEFAQYRGFARLFALEGQTKGDRGDWSGAVESFQDAMLLGQMVPRGSGLMGRLAGNACHARGRFGIWPAVEHLDSATAKRAAVRMLRPDGRSVPLTETLEEERWKDSLGLKDIFAGRCKDPDVKDWAKLLPDFVKRKVLHDYSRFTDEAIRKVQLPYASKPAMPEPKRSLNPLYWPADIILAIFVPGFDGIWFNDVSCQARDDLIAVALALQAYHEDHHRYPDKLSVLVPAYLPRLPADPFAMKATFGYRREGSHYVLWSVGPDCKDDGGKPITDPKRPAAYRHGVTKESKGDIVAGVNL